MDDTSSEIKKKYQEMLMKRSGVERLIMGAGMAEAAKVIALSSMDQEENESNNRIRLFLRFYFKDFSKSERAKIMEHLKGQ